MVLLIGLMLDHLLVTDRCEIIRVISSPSWFTGS